MRKHALMLIVLVLGLAVGCSTKTPSPTPTPTPLPPPPTPTTPPQGEAPPAGPASCSLVPLEFPVLPGVPAVTEDEHIHGPADAPITLIEYADFQ